MRERTWITIQAIAAALTTGLLAATVAQARIVTVDIKRGDVQTHTPADTSLGKYYVFDIPVPAKLSNETFMDAFIEFYVDAASSAAELTGTEFTTFEVYPLKHNLTGEVVVTDLRPAAMKRTVRIGESRRVRINISEHIAHILDNPSDNFGLVVGSLSGQRLGNFAVKHGALGLGVVARVTIIFHDITVPKASSQP